jgi:hypothetical protein
MITSESLMKGANQYLDMGLLSFVRRRMTRFCGIYLKDTPDSRVQKVGVGHEATAKMFTSESLMKGAHQYLHMGLLSFVRLRMTRFVACT